MQWRLVLHGQHFRHFRKTADLDVTSEPLKYDKRVRCMEILTTEKTHTHTHKIKHEQNQTAKRGSSIFEMSQNSKTRG